MTITATCRECGQVITLPDVDDDCPKDKIEFLSSIIVCNDCVDRKREARRRYDGAKVGYLPDGNKRAVNVKRWIKNYQPPKKVEQPF